MTTDQELIDKIADRAQREVFDIYGIAQDRVDTVGDLFATHTGGCPLDLDTLLRAPVMDFMHDLMGIRRHINRRTGSLEEGFVPRCSTAVQIAEKVSRNWAVTPERFPRPQHTVFGSDGLTLYMDNQDKIEYDARRLDVDMEFYGRQVAKHGIWASNQGRFVDAIEQFNQWDCRYMEEQYALYLTRVATRAKP